LLFLWSFVIGPRALLEKNALELIKQAIFNNKVMLIINACMINIVFYFTQLEGEILLSGVVVYVQIK